MKHRNKNILLYAYIIISLFMFAFVNFNESTNFADYVVPFIEGKVVKIHFYFSLIYFAAFVFFKNKSLKIDNISILLVIKTLLDIISIIINYGSISEYISYLAISASCFIIYFMILNSDLNKESVWFIIRIIIAFGICLCLQVIYTFIKVEVSYSDVQYKYFLNIPIGGTNVIASFINPILALILLAVHKKIIKIPLVVLFVASIILTRSRGGIVLAFFIIIYCLFYYEKGRKKYISAFFGVICFLFFAFIFFTNDNIINIFLGYANSGNIDINSISSGRIELWQSMFKEFKPHYWLIGAGMKPSLGKELTGAHNLLIDCLVRCGIIGGALYLSSIFIAFRHSSNRKIKNIFLVLAVIIFINSMFEVCYFYYVSDWMFWLYLALALKVRRNYNESNSVLSTPVSHI